MKAGWLVKHKEIPRLGVGLVTESLGVHCMVQWTYSGDDRLDPGPTLEANSTLEIVSESR
jgi:hypothetical protein